MGVKAILTPFFLLVIKILLTCISLTMKKDLQNILRDKGQTVLSADLLRERERAHNLTLSKIFYKLDLIALIEKRYKITVLTNEAGELIDISLSEKPP